MTTLSRRYEPHRDVASLHDEVERMFREAFGSGTATAGAFSPALDVEETEDVFTLHVELPGVTADDVEVSLEENVLTIAGERRFYDEKAADGFRRIERHFGRFHRAVRLPDRVDGDKVSATYRDGLLTITVPKAEEAKPRRITVKAS
ncbi:Hsp20/alpha crystallin family protein [Egicoccus sp. AB-alg6-2]|uniref:Hsp20/alpha crystallin family protein n=1 Tax=Egicoccus sp. AB-alg6-2 TaxID=3242692 RepID=UPI00359D99FC